MIVSTRSLYRAGIGAGLVLALAVPATGIANAATTSHSATASVSAATRHAAKVALDKALAKATADYVHAVAAARTAFNQDPTVILAKSQRLAVVGTSTNPALILAANQAYADAVSGAVDTREGSIDAARTARFAAVDAAWAAYDLVVNPPNALARNAYRAAMRSANFELRTHVSAAHKAFRSSTAAAHAQLRASINAAVATYEASGKTPADLTTFTSALAAARTAFSTDPAVIAARTARKTALHNAWTQYAHDVRAARVAFHTATGHWPHGQKIVIPKV
jgi:hypothetical protein